MPTLVTTKYSKFIEQVASENPVVITITPDTTEHQYFYLYNAIMAETTDSDFLGFIIGSAVKKLLTDLNILVSVVQDDVIIRDNYSVQTVGTIGSHNVFYDNSASISSIIILMYNNKKHKSIRVNLAESTPA